MRGGFLLPQQGPQAHPERHNIDGDAPDSSSRPAKEPASATTPAPVRSPLEPAAATTPEQVAVGLAECLDLLRGPTDERRFVGLLLVTKLLPAGDAATIRSVHQAVGPAFLTRLLLPLRTSVAPPPALPPDQATAQQQQEAAQCGLALAVLSSFSRVPELAGSGDVVEKLPLLLNVVRAGGVTPLLAGRWPQAKAGPEEEAADAAADAAAVQDALDCVVAAARSGAEGRAVAAECGAVVAAAAALQSASPSATQQLSLALQLAAAALAEEGRDQLLADSQALGQLLPALTRAFALPADQLAADGGSSLAEQLQLRRALLAVQLEALHVLLLLLPLPYPGCLPGELLDPGARWGAAARRGLALLLRGRISAVQRHSALQLAAAVLDLLGPEWLLGGGGSGGDDGVGASGGGGAQAVDAAEVAAFFQLLVEVVKVETSVLLHDALAPGVPVPLASAAGTAAADWLPPAPRARAGSSAGGSEAGDSVPDAAGAELAADLAGGPEGASVAADVEPLVRVLHSEQDRRQMEEQLRREQEAAAGRQPQQGEYVRRVDETPIPSGMRWDGPSEASGQRAARVLPCCFALLEAGVEALAEDTQRSEALQDDGGDSDGGGEPRSPPVLPAAVAERALFSLQEAVEVVLQFIEQTSCEDAGEGGARQPLMLAALRVLARFCAEVPDAFADRLRPLLPLLLSLRAGEQGAEEGEERLPVPAEGATFLLPLLLQVSDPAFGSAGGERRREEHQLWLDALASPATLQQLVQYVAACAAGCAPAVTAAAVAAADHALINACHLLMNLVSPGPAAQQQQPAAAAAKLLRRRRQLLAAGGTLRLVHRLLQLARFRPVVSPADSKPGELVHAARMLTTIAALVAAVAASVAAELEQNGGSQPDDGLPLRLRLSTEDQARVEAKEAEEEARERSSRRQRDRGRQAAAAPPRLPFLGPLSGPRMHYLCTQLLSAMQVAEQLACSEAHQAQLVPTGGTGAGSPAARLAAARSAVAADQPLRLELAGNLEVAASEAAVLVRSYPPFGRMCRESNWVAAEMALARRRARRAAAAPPGAPAAAPAGVEELPGLKLFLAAVAAG